jgi:hypothetical protein
MRTLPTLLITCVLVGCSQPTPVVPLQITDVEPLPPLTDWPNVNCVGDNCPPPETKTECINLNRLLAIIKQMESSGGVNCEPRFEPNFLRKYGDKGIMPELRRLFGDEAAASSYGPYQIMLCVAWENDFRYSPEQLANPENNQVVAEFLIGKYAEQYVNLPVRDRVWKIAKRYNGGNGYADKVQSMYFEN